MANVAFKTYVQALTNKTTPTGADSLVIVDSADSNNDKETTITGIYNYVKSLTDTLYQAVLVSGTNIKTINSTSILGSGDISITGGTGDVTGPASAVNNNIAVFDTTTGKLIKDGGATIASKQDADADLTAIAALSGTGIAVRTGAGTWAERDLSYPAAGLTISNSAGIAGNPTFALANDLAAVEGLSGTGVANRTGTDTWTTNTLDTDGTLAANSDTTIATQKATKTYADTKALLAGSASQAFAVSQLEVGHASDTTITRTGAGAIAVEGVAIPTISSTSTITGKRNQPRVVSAASYTTDTGTSLDFSTCDLFVVTAQAGALKFNNPSGTPVHGEKILIRVKDNGTARALTYDTQYRAIGITLPTTTVISKTTYILGIWNATDSKVDCLAVGQEA